MEVRQYLGLAGIVLALAGVALESRYVVWAAIGLLGTSVLLKVLQAVRRRRAENDNGEARNDAGAARDR
ncbi:MAG: hypothetical protein H6R40_1071 [Gemmatimonadetes bacterium]|nr:hypothetical protein [Gemmatimonadota bacterium]